MPSLTPSRLLQLVTPLWPLPPRQLPLAAVRTGPTELYQLRMGMKVNSCRCESVIVYCVCCCIIEVLEGIYVVSFIVCSS